MRTAIFWACTILTMVGWLGLQSSQAQATSDQTLQQEVEALRAEVRQLTETVEKLQARLDEQSQETNKPKTNARVTGSAVEEALLHAWYWDGELGNGYTIQGGQSVLTIPGTDLSLNNQTAFSVVAWVKSDLGADSTQTQDIMSWWNYPASRSWVLTHHNNGRYLFEIQGKGYITGGNTGREWTMIAATYDGSIMRLYVNGELAADLNGLVGNVPMAQAPIILGGQADGTNGFHGQIDEARIFARVITADEVRQEYEALAPPAASAVSSEESREASAVYCVRAGARGRSDGSDWDNAFPVLPEQLQRGAIYYLAGGEYPGYLADDPTEGESRIIIRKATEAEHGPEEGWDDRYGTAAAEFYGPWRFESPHWLVDGVTGGGPGSWREGFGIRIHTPNPLGPVVSFGGIGVSHCEIQHVAIQGGGNDGDAQGNGVANDAIYIGPGSHHITFSHFHAWDAGRSILWMRTGPVTLEYGCTGQYESTEGQHAEIASVEGEVTLRHCLFTHVEGTGGLIFMGMGPFRVHGNVFWNDPNGEPWFGYNGVVGSWSAKTMVNLTATNNTFINIPKHMPVFGSLYTRKAQNIARNNFFYNCPNLGGGVLTEHGQNKFVNSSLTWREPDSNPSRGDLGEYLATTDFRPLHATEPGRELEGEYAYDAWGNRRGTDGVWDRGAYEFADPKGSTNTASANN